MLLFFYNENNKPKIIGNLYPLLLLYIKISITVYIMQKINCHLYFRTTLDTSATDLTSQVNYLLSTVTQSMSQPMNEAVTIMKDLLRVITPKCDVELQRLFYGYLDEHNRMHSNVLEMKNLILDYGELLNFGIFKRTF